MMGLYLWGLEDPHKLQGAAPPEWRRRELQVARAVGGWNYPSVALTRKVLETCETLNIFVDVLVFMFGFGFVEASGIFASPCVPTRRPQGLFFRQKSTLGFVRLLG